MTRLRSTGGCVWPMAVAFAITAGGVACGQAKQAELPTALATNYLPPDTSFAVLVRPAALAVPEVMLPVVEAFDAMLKPADFPISVADIDECKFVFLGIGDPMRGRPEFYLTIRARRAADWKQVFDVAGLQQEEVDGHKLYVRGPEAIWLPDDRTIVVGMRASVERTMGSPDPNDRAAWWDDWRKAATRPLAGFLHSSALGVMTLPGPDGRPDRSLAPLGKDARYGVLAGDVTDKGFAIQAIVQTNSNAGSVRVAPLVSRGLTNFASLIATQSGLTGDDADRLTENLASLLEGTQIVTQGKTMEIKAVVTPKMLEVFAESARLMAGQ